MSPRRCGAGIRISLLAVLLAACASGNPSPTGDSGVEGHVFIGPMCPVVQVGTDCPDSPYQALLVVEDGRGREVGRTESSADGAYRIPLAAGSYRLVPQPGESGLPWAEPIEVAVAEGVWVRVDIRYDSGIR
ncbi:MAG TPA: hypothetical protein VLD63_13900 [Anaerolineales bacterium]|nr:hypothetical protein [Anaerolineales bacterium]